MSELCDVADEMLDAARSRSDVNQRIGQGLVQLNRLMGDGIRDDIEEAKDLTQDNIDGLDDLTALAQGLKDFSRLDRAQQGTFDVNEGLERTLLIAKNKLKNKATIHKQFGPLPKIYCSPSQINQVFLNLLTNAADAIEDHGDITISTRTRHGQIEIDVADTGCGIEASTLAKIPRPVLYHQGCRTGDRPWPVDRRSHRFGTRRRPQDRVRAGTRDDGYGGPAHRRGRRDAGH